MAAEACNAEDIKTWLAAGANVNATDSRARTPLHLIYLRNASRPARVEAAIALLASPSIDVNMQQDDLSTPLHLAAYRSETVIALPLLAKGALINAKDKDGFTPFYHAVHNPTVDREMVEAFIKGGADVNEKNERNERVLVFALRERAVELAKILVQNGAHAVKVEKENWEHKSTCNDCDKPFTLTKRKQNCYSCGGRFCAGCLNKQSLPAYEGKKKVSCKTCIDHIFVQSGTPSITNGQACPIESSILEISGLNDYPLNNIVLGKYIVDGGNNFNTKEQIRSFVVQAQQNLGWNGGVMLWEWLPAQAPQWIDTIYP